VEHLERAESQKHLFAAEVSGHLPELWLVACAYEYMAAGTLCSRCGSPLGDDTRILIGTDGGGGVMVSTGCRGRRRHQYIARVTERRGDLLFGRFEQRQSGRRLRKNLRDAGAVFDSKWTRQPGDVE
jgi:hypothetical protein